MVKARVITPSSAGENGTRSNVEYSDLLSRLNQVDPTIRPENAKVKVSKASIKARPLDSIPILVHKVVEVEVSSELLDEIFYVTAELNRNGADGVINIRSNLREMHAVDTVIEVELCEKDALLSDLIAVLVNHSSKYNVVRDNCYQYADNVFRDVVERFGIRVAPSTKLKATLQGLLDNHPRPVLPKDVIKKKHAAGAVVGTSVATAAVATVAVECWPITVVALILAPQAFLITAGVICPSPAIFIGLKQRKRACRCIKGALVPRYARFRAYRTGKAISAMQV